MRKPKSKRQELILANDKLFRLLILARDKCCQKTGNTERLQVHHFISRDNKRVRWEPDNGILLCSGSHKFFAHKYPEKFREWFISRLGQERFDKLILKANYVAPIKMDDLLLTHFWLKKRLAQLTKEV